MSDTFTEELYLKYLQERDPTEYQFAIKHVGSWKAWEDLCTNEEFKPVVERWRRELEAKLKSEALLKILKVAQGDTRDSIQANKYIIETVWFKEHKRGRPTKDDINKEAKRIAEDTERIKDDFLRIFKENQTEKT